MAKSPPDTAAAGRRRVREYIAALPPAAMKRANAMDLKGYTPRLSR